MKKMCNVQTTSQSNYLKVIPKQKDRISPEVEEYHYKVVSAPEMHSDLTRSNLPPLEDRPFVRLRVTCDILGIVGMWKPDGGFQKALHGDWSYEFKTNISHSAPILCFFDSQDSNRFTISVSELSKDICFTTGVHEETAEIYTEIIIYLTDSSQPYHFCCRIDTRPLRFEQIIQETAVWWDLLLPEETMPVPEEAISPMYSTWYSYHQELDQQNLLRECYMASEMGMRSVIIDDGWQTRDNHRGYGYCGDWVNESSKFHDFREFVDNVHRLGMKCILWYSVPFLGKFSDKWETYKNLCLHYEPSLQAGVLDPRYPQVREYLISVYREALLTWDLDGFKLDFIDSFRDYKDTPPFGHGMDYSEISQAVHRLMIDIRHTLLEIKQNLMFEFRQNYIGPQIRRYGNIFRVADCPLSGITNRVGITDLRLLSGSCAVHSDMLLWHKLESPEDIAIQIINCIFATLQISVRLDSLEPRQRQVLEHYIDFSVKYRETLLKGSFTAKSPLGLYPVLLSATKDIKICAVYEENYCVDFSDSSDIWELWILNGTHGNIQYVILPDHILYSVVQKDCMGKIVSKTDLKTSNKQVLSIPSLAGGSLCFIKQETASLPC